MPQPMQNPEDSSDPTTAMNMALALMAKAFKFNTIPVNNNQRSSLIPCNSRITQPGMNMSQDMKMKMADDSNVENMNGLSVVLEIAYQYGNGNVVTALAKGNGNGINEEEAGIQSTQEEFEFMTVADAHKETGENGSTEVPKDENCYDHDIFNMLTDLQTELDHTKEKLENCIIKKEKEYVVLLNNWYTKCEECKYDKISYDKAYNDMQQKIEWLQAQLGDQKGKSKDTPCVSN
ncbi:hypothetical protein Tco_1014492 [Tanacetum coccineum]